MKESIIFKELWDKPSKKGYPTKESVVVTIAIYPSRSETDVTTAGYAVKVPHDQHIPKVGRGIARKAQYHNLFDVELDNPEKYIMNYLQIVDKKYNKNIMNRLRMISHNFPEICSKQYEKNYVNPISCVNNIED